MRRRLIIASAFALALHLVFLLTLAPELRFRHTRATPTEVEQIDQAEVERIKDRILTDKQKGALLQHEALEQHRTKERPEDATMVGRFNQRVPKETVVGPQKGEPLDGGGNPIAQSPPKPRQDLDLRELGLGTDVPVPLGKQSAAPQGVPGPTGPKSGPSRSRGLGREKTGDRNLLNAAESEFYSFFLRLDEPIYRNWFFLARERHTEILRELVQKRVPAGARLPVLLEMVIDRQGNFHSLTVAESSGIASLDRLMRDSVLKLGSIPNPPPELFEGGQYYVRYIGVELLLPSDKPLYQVHPDLSW